MDGRAALAVVTRTPWPNELDEADGCIVLNEDSSIVIVCSCSAPPQHNPSRQPAVEPAFFTPPVQASALVCARLLQSSEAVRDLHEVLRQPEGSVPFVDGGTLYFLAPHQVETLTGVTGPTAVCAPSPPCLQGG